MQTELQPLQRLPAHAPLDVQLGALAEDGGVVVEGLFDRETIATIRDAADAFAAGVEPGGATQGMGAAGKEFVGANTIRFSSLGLLTPAFFDLLDNARFGAIADAVLLPTCGSYWINTAQVMYIGPGEPAQVLHRDADNWWEWMSRTWPDTPEVTISAMVGLDQVTEELGATRVVPGSHHQDPLDYRTEVQTVPAELGPGDALVYSGHVFHGGGANRTEDQWRRAIHLSFVAGWLTPEEAIALDHPLGSLAHRSERVQRLIGHRSYTPGERRGGGLWLRHVKAIEEA
ncbi:MAG: phytanoyl-CoA dioxygenase family protein [Actinomycetota bacterium]